MCYRARHTLVLVALGWLVFAPSGLHAQSSSAGLPAEGIETAAERLQASTVTLRISEAKPTVAARSTSSAAVKAAAAKAGDSDSAVDGKSASLEAALGKAKLAGSETPDEITVCSAVAVGAGQIVTFSTAAPGARYRVTLPSGDQAEAEPRVVDAYSGLLLLQIPDRELPPLKLADELPKVGGVVATAAAAGIERPAISRGILGGVQRTLSGVDLPPLLQCDVRTTETSSGAAVVDAAGNLIGIVAAAGAPGEGAGWTYALPVSHVRRLLTAWQDKKLVELKRRRPVVGLTLGPGAEGAVRVERVEQGGPADKAGIRVGDIVTEAEGRKIRSAYQAVNLILRKQPGDRFAMVLQNQGNTRNVDLTLEGSTAVLAAATDSQTDSQYYRVGPQLKVSATNRSQVEVYNGARNVAEVAVEANGRARRSPGDELEMLRIQVTAFEKVIRKLQDELALRADAQAETEKVIANLRSEVERLKGQMEAAK